MTKSKPIIDFSELVSPVPGEGLEQLTRQIAKRMGLSPSWSGRGPDGGRDLLFTEILSGPLTNEKVTWLVSCKDRAGSGGSVNEKDLPQPGIMDKVSQFRANGFILVTTTTVTAGAKALIDSLDKKNGGSIHTVVWDSSDLTTFLLKPKNNELLKQYLPESYKRERGLNSLEGALFAFRDQIPTRIFSQMMRMAKPYSDSVLNGSSIWPYDTRSANTIDNIIDKLIFEESPKAAVDATEDIEFDAFITLVDILHSNYYDECYEYLISIIKNHPDVDLRYNAAQYVFDNYEISPKTNIVIASRLDRESIFEFFGLEIMSSVEVEILTNSSTYDLHDDIDELSSATQIDYISVEHLSIDDINEKTIHFSGNMHVEITLIFDKEAGGSYSIPGEFLGHFNKHGIFVETASVDTSPIFHP